MTRPDDRGRDLLRALLARDARALPGSEAGWSRLVAEAAELSAEGLLHAAIRRAGDGAAPPAALRDLLRRAHAATAAKNLELTTEAERILAALARAGVTAAPMKGTALFREGIVRDLGTRATTDVDLATAPADRAAALAMLQDLGYAPSRTERSWKHLPPMRRGDLAVELHEIAWWSGRTREVFGASHLAVGDPLLRVARLWALQVHHLVLGSPPDATLLVRTLADVACLAEHARAEPALVPHVLRAAAESGLEREVVACDAIVAGAQGLPPSLGRPATRDAMDRLLAPLDGSPPPDPRVAVLVHFLRTAHRQPLAISAATVRTLLEPPPGDGPALSRTRRAAQLGLRVAGALPRALRSLRS